MLVGRLVSMGDHRPENIGDICVGARSFSTKDKGSNRKTLISSLLQEEPTGKRVKASPDHSSLTSATPVLHPKGVTPQQAGTNGSSRSLNE